MSEMSKIGDELMQAMAEALAHAEGKDVSGIRVTTVGIESVDAKAIRGSGGHVSHPGRRNVLRIMEKEPEVVLRELSSSRPEMSSSVSSAISAQKHFGALKGSQVR